MLNENGKFIISTVFMHKVLSEKNCNLKKRRRNQPQTGSQCEAQVTRKKHVLPVNIGYLFRFNCVGCHISFSLSVTLSLTQACFSLNLL